MHTGALRGVISDDADGQIKFLEGNWVVSNSSFEQFANDGTPYRQSQTGTTTNSSLSFTFRGSAVSLYGTVDVRTMPNGQQDPSWECYLDGKPMPPTSGPSSVAPSGNFIEFCSTPELVEDGTHTLTANITSFGRALYVDQAVYPPSPDLVDDPNLNATVFLDLDEPSFRTIGNWTTTIDSNANGGVSLNTISVTEEAGAMASIDFSGSKISALGLRLRGYNQQDSSGSYRIDNGPEVRFRIPGLPGGNSGFMRNQLLFESGVVNIGPHRLFIRYDGPAAPLILDQFVVDNGDIVPRSLDPSGLPDIVTTSETPRASGNAENSTGPKTISSGGIAGAIVGSLAFVMLLSLLALWLVRQRKSRVADEGGYGEAKFQHLDIEPFHARAVVHDPPSTEKFGGGNRSMPTMATAFSPPSQSERQWTPLLTLAHGSKTQVGEKSALQFAEVMSVSREHRGNDQRPAFQSTLKSRQLHPPPSLGLVNNPGDRADDETSSSSRLRFPSLIETHSFSPGMIPLGTEAGGAERNLVVRRHADSGLRGAVVELPPLYSEA